MDDTFKVVEHALELAKLSVQLAKRVAAEQGKATRPDPGEDTPPTIREGRKTLRYGDFVR